MLLLRSVMTESQKVMSKLERKDKRRAVKGRAGADADLEWLTLNGLEPLIEPEVMQRSREQASPISDDPISSWHVTSLSGVPP